MKYFLSFSELSCEEESVNVIPSIRALVIVTGAGAAGAGAGAAGAAGAGAAAAGAAAAGAAGAGAGAGATMLPKSSVSFTFVKSAVEA